MIKLLILDKDGTLVTTASGTEFVQHPEDQVLLPGVAEAIARYAAEGWVMAIASNQGGCVVRECKPLDFPVGAYYCNGTDKPLMVIRKKTTEGGILLYTAEPRSNGKDWLYFAPTSKVLFQYKTLEMAIAEMQYCLNLIPQIRFALFCPDMNGDECWSVEQKRFVQCGTFKLKGHWRKPGKGMLVRAWMQTSGQVEQILMVGDRPEDQGAAEAAGVDFMWAGRWRGEQ